jgi:hypothetical protein
METKLIIEFYDSEYRFSHGTAPKGRGAWAFSKYRNETPIPIESILWSPADMTYTQAKRYIRDLLKAQGVTGWHGIYVLP